MTVRASSAHGMGKKKTTGTKEQALARIATSNYVLINQSRENGALLALLVALLVASFERSIVQKKALLVASSLSAALQAQPENKSGLILPSSARVSELTYVTIIGTRYSELDNSRNDIIQFGNYLQAEQCTRGGFLPIFWDAPYSYINASTDIGEVVDWITDKFVVANKGDLAVLNNRNKMVNAFSNTEWFQAQVEQSSRAVSRPVRV